MSDNGIDNSGIVLTGTITVSISLISCFALIIIYIILCLQIKFNILSGNEENKESIKKSILDNGAGENSNKKDDKKIGLGSNFMFLLILSNFIGGIFELLLFLHFRATDGELDESFCTLLGVAHNFFELNGICWTTMLTYLFYCSTIVSHEIFYKETKYLIIGFLYSSLISIIFGVGPLLNNYYGESKYLCFFKYSSKEGNNNFILFWNICNATVIGLNCILDCIFLFKTFVYYAKKTHILKKQNEKEYRQLSLYILVFRIFPFVVIITAIIKGSSRTIAYFLSEQNVLLKILGYSNVIIHNLNGFLNSLACFYFFKGVFWCCCTHEKNTSECITEIPETDGLKD